MPKETDSSPVAVRVCIEEWLDGPYGKYARAKVLTPDSPSREAIYGLKALKTQPELGVPFDCKIQLVKTRWRVVELAENAKPVEVTLTGTVESESGSGTQRSWRVRLDGQPASPYAVLDTKILRAARFAHVELGQELSFLALPGDANWEVTHLLSPTLVSVIPDPQVAYAAFALRDWNADDPGASVSFGVKLPGISIWPLVNVFATLLRRQSIPSLVRVDVADPAALIRAQDYVEYAQSVLREGSPQEVDGLKIGCLEIVLVWDARGFWNTKRLTAPIPMREPKSKEAIDWVEGTVIAVDALPQNEAVDTKIDTPDTDEMTPLGEAPEAGSPKKAPSVKVTFEIKDRRVGRGEVKGFMKRDEVVNGGLINGTRAIFQLIGNPPYWNVHCLHRSLPMRGDE